MKNATRAGTALAAAGLLLLVPAAPAFESRGGQVLTIGADEVVADDLYVAAQTFVLEGEVQGDLVVVAQTIEIRGTVEGDLLGFAQSVHISGNVADDVRVGVMDLTVSPSAVIGGDVVAAGLSLAPRRG